MRFSYLASSSTGIEQATACAYEAEISILNALRLRAGGCKRANFPIVYLSRGSKKASLFAR